MIVRFFICGRDISILIEKMLDKISSHDSKEDDVLIIQLIQVLVFDGVYELVLEGFIHCARIIVYYVYFVMLKFDCLL